MFLTELKFTISGNPRPKKNNMQFVRLKNGRTLLVQSRTFSDYKQNFLLQMKNLYKEEPICEPVNVKCHYFRGDKRKIDLVNLENGTLDLLTEAGVIKDDNSNIVVSMDGSRVFYDKTNPRVVIYITYVKKED